MVLTLHAYLAIAGALSIFLWGSAILLFSQISVRHIEKSMTEEGIVLPL